MSGNHSVAFLTLMVSLIALTSGRRKHEPAAVVGYQQEKGGPMISLNDKENIIVEDDDDDDKFHISVDDSLDRDLNELSRSKGQKMNGNDNDYDDDDDPFSRQKIMGMLVSLTERVTSLQHTLTNIKLQNHYIYRTMKKGQKVCKDSSNEVIQSAAQKIEKPKCATGFTENPDTNSCYKFAVERITWRMAREKCMMIDSDLVSIETKDEQRWISTQARRNPDTRHCDFWTGATDKSNEGDWRWVATDNSLSYSNWNHNEPNNGRGDEHCMQMLWVFNWAWNDAKCNYNNACYICEVALKNDLRV